MLNYRCIKKNDLVKSLEATRAEFYFAIVKEDSSENSNILTKQSLIIFIINLSIDCFCPCSVH